jgi:hypothetical protein
MCAIQYAAVRLVVYDSASSSVRLSGALQQYVVYI